MPRHYRRGGMGLRPVNRIKHVVDAAGTVAANATFVTNVIKADDSPILANTTEVVTGSKLFVVTL